MVWSKSSPVKGKPVPKNVITIDHVYHRWDIRRALKRHEVVLSCLECNLKRDFEFKMKFYEGYSREEPQMSIISLLEQKS